MAAGPESIHELVEDAGLSYPVSVARVENEFALENVAIDAEGRSAMVSEILARTEAERFESRDDLVRKLEPAFEAERTDRRVGWMEAIKRWVLGRR